jgi:LmbE family N-acetylglucosaminyl deacetylase
VNVLFKGKKILLVGAHPDDIEAGCGGTVAKYSIDNEVHSVVFAPCLEDPLNAGILEEYRKAMRLLGVKKIMNQELPRDVLEQHKQRIRNILHEIKDRFAPSIVFCHSLGEFHQDHRTVANCCQTIFRDTATTLTYEITRSAVNFNPTLFVILSDQDMAKKLKALQFYKTQYRRNYFKPSVFRGLALVRGSQIKAKYAEAFEIVRMIDK